MTNDKQTNQSDGAQPRSIEEIKADLVAWREAAPSRRSVMLVTIDILDEDTADARGMMHGHGIPMASAISAYAKRNADIKNVLNVAVESLDSELKQSILEHSFAEYTEEVTKSGTGVEKGKSNQEIENR